MPRIYNAPANVQGVVSGRRASSDDLSGAGAGMQSVGRSISAAAGSMANTEIRENKSLVAAQLRISDRADTISRIRAEGAYDLELQAASQAIVDGKDMADPSVIRVFSEKTAEMAQKALSNFSGGADATARLTASLDARRSKAMLAFSTLQIGASRKYMDGYIASETFRIGAEATASGDIDAAFEAMAVLMEDTSRARSATEERSDFDSGRASILKAVFDSFMESGEIEAAEGVLSREGSLELLGDDAKKMRGEITKINRAAAKGAAKGLETIAELEVTSGIPYEDWTPDMKLRASKLAPPVGKKTLSDRVSELATMTGQPVTQDQINKMAGAFIPATDPAVFGKGAPGLALARLTDDALSFGSGSLDDTEMSRYISSAYLYLQEVRYIDPDSGVLVTRRPELPPFVIDAFIKLDIPIPQPGGTGAGDTGDADILSRDAPPVAPEDTVFGLAERVTGPISILKGIAGATPIVGDFYRPEEVEKAKAFVKMLQASLINVLQRNPKFSEGERQSLKRDISIEGEFWDTVGAYRNRVIGIAKSIEVRIKAAEQVLKLPRHLTTLDARKQARTERIALEMFLENLGAPQVMSPEAASRLPEGAFFLGEDGVLYENTPNIKWAETDDEGGE